MKFKEGDRVRVYGNAGKHPAGEMDYFLRGKTARVIAVLNEETELLVEIKDKYYKVTVERAVHPKQCRKLKPKIRTRICPGCSGHGKI